MDPTECPPTKRRKIEFADVDVDVDRISELGDDLLIEILSLLSTKEAVQTSLLAKRFQNLWTSVPVLDFNIDEFCPDDDSDTINNLEDYKDPELLWISLEEKFTKFVDGVFEHRDPSINVDSFNLKWDEEESNPAPAIKWLDTVAKLKPKFLSVNIRTEDQIFQVSDSIFSCKSLQEMELNLDCETIRPRLVDLPCLKKITLRSVVIVNGVMQKLSGLPALEEMVLSNCHFNTCEISSSTLKRLVLEGYPDDYPDEIITPNISISTPSLLYLEVFSWPMGTIELKKMESLVKACIHYREFANKNPMFLTGLSNATSVELVMSESRVLSPGHYKMEISRGLAGKKVHIMETKCAKNKKIKVDINELMKRFYNMYLFRSGSIEFGPTILNLE